MPDSNRITIRTTQLVDMPSTLTANRYLQVKADATGYQLTSALGGSGGFGTRVVDQAGFVGDGTTNDRNACQAAIDAAGSYGIVIWPGGSIGIGSKLDMPYNGQIWIGNHTKLIALAGFATTAGNDRMLNIGAAGADTSFWAIGGMRFDQGNLDIFAINNDGIGAGFQCKTALFDDITFETNNIATGVKGWMQLRNLENGCILNRIHGDRLRSNVGANKIGVQMMNTNNNGNWTYLNSKFSTATSARDCKLMTIGRGATAPMNRIRLQNTHFFSGNDGDGTNDMNETAIEFYWEDISGGGSFSNRDISVRDVSVEDFTIGIDFGSAGAAGGFIDLINVSVEYKHDAGTEREPNHRLMRIAGKNRVCIDQMSQFMVIGDTTTNDNWFGIEITSTEHCYIDCKRFDMRRANGTFVKMFGSAMANSPLTVHLGSTENVGFFSGTFVTASVTRYLPIFGSTVLTNATRTLQEISLRRRVIVRGISLKPDVNTDTNAVTVNVVDSAGAVLGTASIAAGSTAAVDVIFTKTIGGKTNCPVEISDTEKISLELIFGAGTVNVRIAAGFILIEQLALEAE